MDYIPVQIFGAKNEISNEAEWLHTSKINSIQMEKIKGKYYVVLYTIDYKKYTYCWRPESLVDLLVSHTPSLMIADKKNVANIANAIDIDEVLGKVIFENEESNLLISAYRMNDLKLQYHKLKNTK